MNVITIRAYNLESNQEFTLKFKDMYKLRKFIRRCKHSKKIKILAQYGYESEQQMMFVNDYRY